uniref:DEP domain-containing protein n=1 Tax=Trichuris muris TaxID=70415 RepID=A0A5S6R2F7_TRIMR
MLSSQGRTCKLWFHKKEGRIRDLDFLYSSKDFPDLEVGDVLEVYHKEEQFSRLLVQVSRLVEDFLPKQGNTVSVDEALAATFHLKNYGDVIVRKVPLALVSLDLLELSFKEQYVSSSDCFRLRKVLLRKCVQMNKKIEYCGIRVMVQEMHKGGERVACGYVDESTRVVFRSNSALVYIMIQMSLEMWEFDNQGDLYSEKCIDGFLPDLFKKWKEKSCSHFVSIVLFSRWFYTPEAVNGSPDSVRKHLLTNHRGEVYQDFYHLIVHNEQYEDWQPVLSKRFGLSPAKNSTAVYGNFLETLNIPLNFFTKHYLNRSFERTGQLAIVISPGSGVFHVEPALAMLTKMRSIECGTPVDLVCLGEQPFHVVPLFVFDGDDQNSDSLPSADAAKCDEQYMVPHWMNTSYYNPVKHGSSIVNVRSRIKIPNSVLEAPVCVQLKPPEVTSTVSGKNELPDFDKYDSALFADQVSVGLYSLSRKVTPSCSPRTNRRFRRRDRSVDLSLIGCPVRRKLSTRSTGPTGLNPLDIADTRFPCGSSESANGFSLEGVDSTRLLLPENVEVSDGQLIDPFSPAGHSVPISADRRRWIHVFPVDSFGFSKQPHHFYCGSSVIKAPYSSAERKVLPTFGQAFPNVETLASDGLGKEFVWAWGPTGEECWNPEIEVCVDWKSLTLPACLPITTDFFPDLETLRNDYYVSEHSILLDESVKDAWQSVGDFRADIFGELICQRLQRGFQIIQTDTELLHSAKTTILSNVGVPEYECFLGENCTYHRLALIGQTVYVSKFLPRQNTHFAECQYYYLLQGPDVPTYNACSTIFQLDRLGGINWSFLDNMIIMRGEGEDFRLTGELECFECRFMLVPFDQSANEHVLNSQNPRCDSFFKTKKNGELSYLDSVNKFVKFMEILNRLRRTSAALPAEPRKPNSYSITSEDVLLAAAFRFLSITSSHSQLPSRMIVSAAFVHWLLDNAKEIVNKQQAVAFGQRLVSMGKIRPVRTDRQCTFEYGFILYHAPGDGSKEKTGYDLSSIVEVRVVAPPTVPYRIRDSTRDRCAKELRNFRIDFDPNRRSDRKEWGQVRVGDSYDSNLAYEISMRWVVGTSSLVGDLVHNWWRKSISLGLNLVPVPIDPFVMPENPDSDPFRNPIFVPLNEAIVGSLSIQSRLSLLYHILDRFGFLPMNCFEHGRRPEFIHSSGGMLVTFSSDSLGYLWTWNPMVGLRYRSQLVTGDAQFQDKILHDLQRFCEDHEQRLSLFLQENHTVLELGKPVAS